MFSFALPRTSRKPSLTPMIDVVFLLLVFFMLSARFGQDFALPLSTAGRDVPYQGPPRLIDIRASDLALNGTPTQLEALSAGLAPLMQSPDDPVLLRPGAGADVQALVRVIDALRAAGLTQLIVVEGAP